MKRHRSHTQSQLVPATQSAKTLRVFCAWCVCIHPGRGNHQQPTCWNTSENCLSIRAVRCRCRIFIIQYKQYPHIPYYTYARHMLCEHFAFPRIPRISVSDILAQTFILFPYASIACTRASRFPERSIHALRAARNDYGHVCVHE